MASIGSLAAILTVQANDWNAGLDKAQSRLAGFGSFAKSTLGAVGLGVSLGATIRMFRSLADEIDVNAKAARKLGISFAALEGIQFSAGLAGVGGDDLTSLMGKLNRVMGDLHSGSAETVKDFQKLGLTSRDLKGLGADKALLLMLDRLSAIPDKSERAAAAFRLVGRDSEKMLTLVEAGSGSLRDMAAEMQSISLTDRQAAQVEKANDSWSAMIGLIKTAGKHLLAYGQDMADTFAAFNIALFSQEAAKNFLAAASAQTQTYTADAREAAEAAAVAIEAEKALQKHIADVNAEIRKLGATLGMSTEEIKLWELAQKGATEAQLREIEILQDNAKAIKDMEDIRREGTALMKEMATPLEKLNADMEHWGMLLATRAIDLDTYNRAVYRSVEAMDALKEAQFELAPSLSFGSAEALSTINKMRSAPAKEGAQERVARVLEQARVLQERTARATEETARAVRDQRPPRPATIQ